MQSGKKKSKPLNLLKPVALPSQVLQDDQNIIEQAFVKSEKNKENGQNICKKVRRTKNSNRPLNIIKGAFDL